MSCQSFPAKSTFNSQNSLATHLCSDTVAALKIRTDNARYDSRIKMDIAVASSLIRSVPSSNDGICHARSKGRKKSTTSDILPMHLGCN
ncbi:hypothetical protein AB6A40_005047 [Gnathostoma spinigerum]|uniref:Uncharacterized protein n=1 Tax=Gnathostoma spinigerum TaxID=75299 RepID=A0ABD6EEB5_9BILA